MLAVLCSGQGGQHARMLAGAAGEPEVLEVLDGLRDATGFDTAATVRAAGEDSASLFVNAVAQPLICAIQLALWSALARSAAVFAGYSVGELVAHGCAGRLTMADTLTMSMRRAAAMDAASDGDQGLVAVRGLSRATIDALCVSYAVSVAIVNGDDHFICGGRASALDLLMREATRRGGDVQRLPVAIAAHTPLLAAAARSFHDDLALAHWQPSPAIVLAGIDGSMVRDPSKATDVLARQIATPILWTACMDSLVERGVTTCLELGPGNALARLVRARYPGVQARGVDEFRSLAAVADWVEGN